MNKIFGSFFLCLIFQTVIPLPIFHNTKLSFQEIEGDINDPIFKFQTIFSRDIFPLSFVGKWKLANESAVPSIYYELKQQSGKIMLNFNGGFSKKSQLIWYEKPDYENILSQLQIVIIDGNYNDNKVYFLEFGNITGFPIDLSTRTFQIKRDSIFYNMSLQVDISDIMKYDEASNSFSSNPDGRIKIQMNIDQKSLEAELIKDTRDYKKTISFEIFFRTIMIVTALTNIILLKKLFPFSLESNKTYIFTPSCIATWDLIFLLNIYIAPTSELLFFTEIGFYEISPSLLLILPVLRMARELVGRNVPMTQVHQKVCTTFIVPIFISFFLMIFSIRIFFNNTFFFLMNLYLVPQIVRNAILGAPVSFSPSHIACIISLRPLFPIYLKGVPDNIFQVSSSIPLTLGIIAALILQVLILYLQSKYGARFFIPHKVITNNYNYFRDFSMASSQGTELLNMTKVCRICMEELSEEPNEEGILDDEAKANLRRMNMDFGKIIKTECKHKFHAICLLEWMTIKMECPQCGLTLKPMK